LPGNTRNMRKVFLALLLIAASISFGQYKNDNVKFQAVYLEDLCQALQTNPGFILLDVRSKGEHYDTSTFLNLNIGHLKNAINIDINQITGRLNELKPYKDKPVFVYCSHSQRSRRVSSMLADSGFSKVFNINGGLTSIHLLSSDISVCPGVEVETNLPYKIITPSELNRKVSAGENFTIIDIRTDSVYNANSTDERRNALGRFEQALNIPLADLSARIKSMRVKYPILVVDDFGNESPKAISILKENGFNDVTVLFNGMDAWSQFMANEKRKTALKQVKGAEYSLVTGEAFDEMMRKAGRTVVIDVRSAEEFTNMAKDAFRNVGNIKTAVNMPVAELKKQAASLPYSKTEQIVLYTFGTSNDIFEAAKALSINGYKNVNVLHGGIFNLRWKAANLKGREGLKEWVENVPPENL
jgi:rhodanese-related sulfurtransferase